MKSNKEEGDVH